MDSDIEEIVKNTLIGKKFKFPKNTQFNWSQDFGYYMGNIFHDVVFTIKDILSYNPLKVDITAPGYGERPNYGNGSIFVKYKDIKKYEIK